MRKKRIKDSKDVEKIDDVETSDGLSVSTDDDQIDETEAHSDYIVPDNPDKPTRYNLSGMYRNWFLITLLM